MKGLNARIPAGSRRSRVLVLLCCLLVASIAGGAILYPLAVRPRILKSDQPLVDRTIGSLAIQLRISADELRRDMFPTVMHLGRKTCVNLNNADGTGNYYACYDRSGKLVEEGGGVE